MLKLDDYMLKSPEFTKFLSSREGRVWLTLYGNISRNEKDNTDIYNKFYKNNKLAAKISLDSLNRQLGYETKDKSNIIKIINKLVKQKLIKKHTFIVNKIATNVYELGYITGNNREEVPYALELYYTKLAQEKIKKWGFNKNDENQQSNQYV